MGLLSFPRLRRTGRTLRRGRGLLSALTRIADALEHHNRLLEALNPDAVQRLRQPDTLDSGVSYVDPATIIHAEQVRADIHRQTGRWMTDEQLMDYLQATEGADTLTPVPLDPTEFH